MRLDTPIGQFTIHFHVPSRAALKRRNPPRIVSATLHRGVGCQRRDPSESGGYICGADSAAHAEITNPKTRPFRRDRGRAEALAKTMRRLGLNRPERTHLWRSYFALINGPLPRRCIGVVTTCREGHRHLIHFVPDSIFPDHREFCGAAVKASEASPAGQACGLATLAAKHRYLYAVDLPEGRRARRQQRA